MSQATSMPEGMLVPSELGTQTLVEKRAPWEEPSATVTADEATELVSHLKLHVPESNTCLN